MKSEDGHEILRSTKYNPQIAKFRVHLQSTYLNEHLVLMANPFDGTSCQSTADSRDSKYKC